MVKTMRNLWVSPQSVLIIFVLIFFDSHGFSFYPNIFGLKFYGYETEQLKNIDKKFWKYSHNFALFLLAVIFNVNKMVLHYKKTCIGNVYVIIM